MAAMRADGARHLRDVNAVVPAQIATAPGWVVPSSAADVPDGDHVAELLWWWMTVPLEPASDAAWVNELAALPGTTEFLDS
ncbi:hypothetical protein [Xylanimonas sp. McL0601]|uniref:hypothetical protein n=1 Tax=Xylanimonas sp. McL0601 TaxID=3414739 RepID=UPI003CEE9936